MPAAMVLAGVGWGFTSSDALIFQAITAAGGDTRTVCAATLSAETGLPPSTLWRRLQFLHEKGRLHIRPAIPGPNTYKVLPREHPLAEQT